MPLGYLLWHTFVNDGQLTLDSFREAYGTYGLGSMLASSAVFAAGSSALAIVTGTLLAYLVMRTDVPGRAFLFAAALAPVVVPGLLYTIAWIFLASPRTGALNRLLEPVLGPGTFDVFSMGGMIVAEGLHLAPLVFLLMVAAFRSIDPALEESALVAGARLPTLLRRVTFPLARPALLAAVLIVGVRAVESFEVPALLGIPGGIWVFTSRIWRALGEHPLDLGEAGAYAVVLLAMTTLGVVAAGRLTGRSRRFETLTGRRSAQRRIPLGRWRPAALVFVSAYVLVAVVLPLLALVYASTQPHYRALSLESLSGATLDNYASVLTDSQMLRSLGNSVLLAVGTATAVTLATAVVAWLVVRARVPGGSLLDSLVFLPIAVPGIVLGVALLAVYLRLPLPVYGTLWILLIAYFTRFMPYGMRYASSSMTQIARELEESAATCGARWWQAFRRVLLPLALPGLAAGWITVVVFSLRELSSSILLYSPGNEVLAITIWEQYENGQFTELAALGVLMVIGLVCLVTISYRLAGRAGLRNV